MTDADVIRHQSQTCKCAVRIYQVVRDANIKWCVVQTSLLCAVNAQFVRGANIDFCAVQTSIFARCTMQTSKCALCKLQFVRGASVLGRDRICYDVLVSESLNVRSIAIQLFWAIALLCRSKTLRLIITAISNNKLLPPPPLPLRMWHGARGGGRREEGEEGGGGGGGGGGGER